MNAIAQLFLILIACCLILSAPTPDGTLEETGGETDSMNPLDLATRATICDWVCYRQCNCPVLPGNCLCCSWCA